MNVGMYPHTWHRLQKMDMMDMTKTIVTIDSDPQTLGPDASRADILRYRAALEMTLNRVFTELDVTVELSGRSSVITPRLEDQTAVEQWISWHWVDVLASALPDDDDRCPHGMFYNGAGACPDCGG